jgi:hypothetical protein
LLGDVEGCTLPEGDKETLREEWKRETEEPERKIGLQVT